MRFFARLDPISAIHKNWFVHGRVSGMLDGVLFRWDGPARVYASGEILEEAIERFRARADKAVILEVIQTLPPVAEPEPEVRRPARRRLAE